jgi:hypothetical protein
MLAPVAFTGIDSSRRTALVSSVCDCRPRGVHQRRLGRLGLGITGKDPAEEDKLIGRLELADLLANPIEDHLLAPPDPDQ